MSIGVHRRGRHLSDRVVRLLVAAHSWFLGLVGSPSRSCPPPTTVFMLSQAPCSHILLGRAGSGEPPRGEPPYDETVFGLGGRVSVVWTAIRGWMEDEHPELTVDQRMVQYPALEIGLLDPPDIEYIDNIFWGEYAIRHQMFEEFQRGCEDTLFVLAG